MNKLTFIVVLLCLASGVADAQTEKRKIEYGLNIGGGLAIQTINNNAVLANNSIRTFNANANVKFPILQQYYLRVALGVSNKGSVVTEDALTTTNKIFYYQISPTIVRKYNLPTLGKIIGGVGLYVAMGDHGTLSYETPNSNTSDRIAFGNENDYKRLDSGISLLTGLELNNHLVFGLGYNFGVANIASQTLKDTGTKSIYNREFTVGLGFVF